MMPKGFPKRLELMPPLTKRQQSIIAGCLLGDGGISKQSPSRWTGNLGNCEFYLEQSKRLDYQDWVYQELSPFSKPPKFRLRPKMKKINGIIFHDKSDVTAESHTVRTCVHPYFTNLRKLWYPEGIKIVPKDLNLDLMALTMWAVGDGCNKPKDKRFVFCTHSFALDEVEFLIEKLKGFGVDTYHYSDKKDYVISTHPYSYDKLIDLIAPNVCWDCFKYKVMT